MSTNWSRERVAFSQTANHQGEFVWFTRGSGFVEWLAVGRSTLCPVPAGAAILRDARCWHGEDSRYAWIGCARLQPHDEAAAAAVDALWRRDALAASRVRGRGHHCSMWHCADHRTDWPESRVV